MSESISQAFLTIFLFMGSFLLSFTKKKKNNTQKTQFYMAKNNQD